MSEKMTVRALRVNRGKTQEECAKFLGMSNPTYRSKEDDTTLDKWKFNELCNLADFLGYSIEVFR